MTFHPALDGIDLVVFDKDGTLISFDAMWSGWARELGSRLEIATRRPVAGDVFATIGYDPVADRVGPGGPLAVATMAGSRSSSRPCSGAGARASPPRGGSWPMRGSSRIRSSGPCRLRTCRSCSRRSASPVAGSPSQRPTTAARPRRPWPGSASPLSSTTVLCGDDPGPTSPTRRRSSTIADRLGTSIRPDRDGRRHAGGPARWRAGRGAAASSASRRRRGRRIARAVGRTWSSIRRGRAGGARRADPRLDGRTAPLGTSGLSPHGSSRSYGSCLVPPGARSRRPSVCSEVSHPQNGRRVRATRSRCPPRSWRRRRRGRDDAGDGACLVLLGPIAVDPGSAQRAARPAPRPRGVAVDDAPRSRVVRPRMTPSPAATRCGGWRRTSAASLDLETIFEDVVGGCDARLPARSDGSVAVRRAPPHTVQPRRPSRVDGRSARMGRPRCRADADAAGLRADPRRARSRSCATSSSKRPGRPATCTRGTGSGASASRRSSSATSPRTARAVPRRRPRLVARGDGDSPAASPTRWRPPSATPISTRRSGRSRRRLEAVEELAIRLNRTREIEEIAEAARRGAQRLIAHDTIRVYRVDHDAGMCEPMAFQGTFGGSTKPDHGRHSGWPIGEGLTGWAIAEQRDGPARRRGVGSARPRRASPAADPESILAVPISFEDHVLRRDRRSSATGDDRSTSEDDTTLHDLRRLRRPGDRQLEPARAARSPARRARAPAREPAPPPRGQRAADLDARPEGRPRDDRRLAQDDRPVRHADDLPLRLRGRRRRRAVVARDRFADVILDYAGPIGVGITGWVSTTARASSPTTPMSIRGPSRSRARRSSRSR